MKKTEESISRRSVLIAATTGLVAVACGEDADGTATASTSDNSATSGNSSTSSGATTTSSGGGASPSGTGAGGMNTGGSNPSAGGSSASSMGNGACMAALVVKGSNYAKDPHDVMIPMADLLAGQEKMYTSTGNGHTHNITLTAADFEALSKGMTVKKYTCLNNPSYTDHEWVFSCADPNIMPTFEGEIGTKSNCPGDQA